MHVPSVNKVTLCLLVSALILQANVLLVVFSAIFLCIFVLFVGDFAV